MKYQKLLVVAALVCLKVCASGVAMAANRINDGFFTGISKEDVIVDGESAFIREANISGDLSLANIHVTVFIKKISPV